MLCKELLIQAFGPNCGSRLGQNGKKGCFHTSHFTTNPVFPKNKVRNSHSLLNTLSKLKGELADLHQIGYSRKNPHGGLRTWNFWGSLRKNVEIPGVDQKRSGNSRGIQEKLMWNFHGSWFLTLEFPRAATQICRISRGKSFFSLEFLGVK